MAIEPHKAHKRSAWVKQLQDLSLISLGCQARQQGDLLRELNELLIMAPEYSLIIGLCPLKPATLEALIEARAYDSAALAMAEGVAYLISQDGDRNHMATVLLPVNKTEHTATGATLALAIISAVSLALANGGAVSRAHAFTRPESPSVRLH